MGYLYHLPVGVLVTLALISVWELVWKGMGLWRAAQQESKPWFIAILVLNTLGVLPIIYLFITREGK